MAVSMIGPKFYAWDSDTGKPLAFGKVYTYQAGTNIPKATFTTEGGETENANPVILNGAGYADIFLSGSYKIVVKDADDVEVWTSDPVSDPSQLQQEWVRQRNITQVNTTSFTVNGELTDEYVEGVAVRVKQDSGFVTGTVSTATYADGKTTVVLDFPGTETIDTSAIYAERALVSFQSLPKNLGDRTIYVGSVAELEALSLAAGVNVYLTEEGRAGEFVVKTGMPPSDPQKGIYIVLANGNYAERKFNGHLDIRWFGAVGDDSTNNNSAIQGAINIGLGDVFVPKGIFQCANIQFRNNLRIFGGSWESVLKLLPNAITTSYNGGVADSNGFFPGNILASTLDHTGGYFYDSGTRARDENNSVYIYENVTVENLTLDGNKAQNTEGDLGNNRSAMGAGVALHQCKNVTIRNNQIINNRLDGIHVGYTLHGGSDYCTIENNHFEGNARTQIALITGKYNSVINNTGIHTGSGASLDIEANFSDEVNFRHSVIGNRLGGGIGIVSKATSKLYDTTFTGNVWAGSLSLSGSDITSGVVIDGDIFLAQSATQDWISKTGPNVAKTDISPAVIKNCAASGFANVLKLITQGAQENFIVQGCTFKGESFGQLVRGYKVSFIDNTFNFSGNASSSTIALSNSLGGTVPNQGQIKFERNTFYGTSNGNFLNISRDGTWPQNYDDFVFRDNLVDMLAPANNTFSGVNTLTVAGNTIKNFSGVSLAGGSNKCVFDFNNIESDLASSFFTNIPGSFKDVTIKGNTLRNISINLTRPERVNVSDNSIYEGKISITYNLTSVGIGACHICSNRLTSTSGIAEPFTATEMAASFNAADSSSNDQYKYNTFTGYVGAPNISAAVAGISDGTFG